MTPAAAVDILMSGEYGLLGFTKGLKGMNI